MTFRSLSSCSLVPLFLSLISLHCSPKPQSNSLPPTAIKTDGGQAKSLDCSKTPCPSTGFYCDLNTKQCVEGCVEDAQCNEFSDCNTSTRTCECSYGVCGQSCCEKREWVEKGGSPLGISRDSYAVAYDASRGTVLLFGGLTAAPLADTWEWDGDDAVWTKRNPVVSPSARFGHALAYDASRKTIVLFGGNHGSRYSDETWEWRGEAGTWTQRNISGSPPARVEHSLTYDASRKKLVLFGGSDGAQYLGDTWEWDGNAARWTQRNARGAPTPRIAHAQTFDSARNRIILFGGLSGTPRSPTWNNELWEWNGTAGTWTERDMTDGPDTSKDFVAPRIAYDFQLGKVILVTNTTWYWDPEENSWALLGETPERDDAGDLVYDEARQVLFWFDGDASWEF